MPNQHGKLYVVATPIGNLADFSLRAIETLQQVDLVCAEDTRHARTLLQHHGITTHCIALHQHNEQQKAAELIQQIQQGLSIAIISDAGTPMISDPGMPVVALAQTAGISVSPIPGACALIAALSASGLAVTQFSFLGFLPRTTNARISLFKQQKNNTATWVFYESCHRIAACLNDLASVLPASQEIAVAREITKLHETIIKSSIADMLTLFSQDSNMQRGELVVMVSGVKPDKNPAVLSEQQLNTLQVLLAECSIKTAVKIAVEITGARKKLLYQAALELSAAQEQ
ncbi:16S rRNA (cytidine1402-2'-O)-methyltransferase [Bathymodiolus japonicus methanotrophic gill symbiont]|uniref:16S rRNA (cytidine(1402)-2'-O)-methyltransferase n=1 Tax=Bathymodiolus japonicus methanotrophic gill symbiont TaxID=113269 RepID=UPI001B49FF76|nr:16S rRNA (cytidine(1402)-2'-O)-methyltransferase [Bathymodiolus japonicus methanotrophic gill symbiont]GFO73121.1 16S rRNA (cytidine1402-2'-O)-methyltransferase [Bathymodiolus japonicus methanotrophic gill symbiont]